MSRGFRGVWIPSAVWLHTSLSWMEKLMICEIDSLYDKDKGGCFASNAYLGEFFQLSKSRVSEIISSLGQKGHIKITLIKIKSEGEIKTKRFMKVTEKFLRETEGGLRKTPRTRSGNRKTPSENGECISSTYHQDKVSIPLNSKRGLEKVSKHSPIYASLEKMKKKKDLQDEETKGKKNDK